MQGQIQLFWGLVSFGTAFSMALEHETPIEYDGTTRWHGTGRCDGTVTLSREGAMRCDGTNTFRRCDAMRFWSEFRRCGTGRCDARRWNVWHKCRTLVSIAICLSETRRSHKLRDVSRGRCVTGRCDTGRCQRFVTSRSGDAMRCDAIVALRRCDVTRGNAIGDATRGDATRIQTMRDFRRCPGTSPRPWFSCLS